MSSKFLSYVKNPYLTTLQTRVQKAGELDGRRFVVLDDTILYPEGGGQPADHGTLNDLVVVDVQKIDGVAHHFLAGTETESPLPKVDDEVTLHLDWQRRYDHMQQHSAQHLITALADHLFGWDTTSFHLGEQQSDIELDTESVSLQQIQELEDAVADAIRKDLTVSWREVMPAALDSPEIRSRGLPAGHQGKVRIVDINCVDQCACGGTHIRSTCELEAVKLLSTESIRGGTRLFWLAGGRVRRRLQENLDRNRRLREILQTSDDQLAEVVELKLEQQKQSKKRLTAMEKRWAEATAEALAGRPGPWVEAHFEDAGAQVLGQIARGLIGHNPALAVFLTGEDPKGLSFVLAAGDESEADVAATGRKAAELLDGRGGGKGSFFQGRAQSLAKRDDVVQALDS